MKKKKNRFNHVGRSSNEEIIENKKRKIIKIIGIISSILLVVSCVILYFNKDSLELSKIMGNSSIKTVTFAPDSVKSNNLNLFYYKNNNSFVWSLYEKAGFSRDYLTHNYKRLGIKVFDSRKRYLTTFMDNKTFYVNKNFGGQTLILQVFMQHKSSGKKISKLVKLYIDKNSMYNLRVKNMLNHANSLVGYNFNQLKTVYSSFETSNYSGDWCSWFAWNVYYKNGFVSKNSWINSYGDYDYDPDLRFALGWTAYSGYNGYIRGKAKNNVNYIPKPGDLILFKWDDSDSSVDHVGIVKKVTNYYIETIEGNTSGNVNAYNYYLTSKVSIKKRAIVYKKYIGRTYDYNNTKKDNGYILGYFNPKKYF